MSLYFDNLPSELSNIILSYLDYNDLMELDNIMKVNYEALFRLNYPIYYTGFKNIFKIDKYLRQYRNMWELFYNDFINNKVDRNDILMIYHKVSLHKIHTCTNDVYYSFIINYKYPNQYKYLVVLKSMIKFITQRLCISVFDLFENMWERDINIENEAFVYDPAMLEKIDDYDFEYIELLGFILLFKDNISLQCKQENFKMICRIYESENEDNSDEYNAILEDGIRYFKQYVTEDTKDLYEEIIYKS